MSYGYGSYYGYGSSRKKEAEKKKKKKKVSKKAYLYFIIGFIAYPLIVHALNPAQTVSFGKNLVKTVFLGASALASSVISHRLVGIVDKYDKVEEYGKFFLVFMVVYSLVVGWGATNLNGVSGLALMLIAYAVATFVSVYVVSPKKTPKSKVAVATIVIGYVIFAGLVSITGL